MKPPIWGTCYIFSNHRTSKSKYWQCCFFFRIFLFPLFFCLGLLFTCCDCCFSFVFLLFPGSVSVVVVVVVAAVEEATLG